MENNGFKKVLLWGVLIIVLGVFGYQKYAEYKDANDLSNIKIKSLTMSVKTGKEVNGWRAFNLEDGNIKWADADLILHGIAREEFKNLDAFAAQFDKKYPDGDTYRNQFYDKFTDYDDYNQQNPENYHNKYKANLEKWYAENDDAAAPAIASAAFEIYLAWHARGGGYADTVTEEGWKGFHDHIASARTFLQGATEASKQDPHFYRLWITTHLAEGDSFEETQKSFKAGQDVDPTYLPLYNQMAYYLQPKWHGEKVSDWHTWLVTALEHSKLSDEDRLVIYGTVVKNNLRGKYFEALPNNTSIYEYHGVDKDRFMRGIAACAKRYTDSSTWPSAYLYHAVMADSVDSIEEALQLMEGKFSKRVIGNEEKFFALLEYVGNKHPKLAELVKGKSK